MKGKDFYLTILIIIGFTCFITTLMYSSKMESEVEQNMKDSFCKYAIEKKLINLEWYSEIRDYDLETLKEQNMEIDDVCTDIYVRYLIYLYEREMK